MVRFGVENAIHAIESQGILNYGAGFGARRTLGRRLTNEKPHAESQANI